MTCPSPARVVAAIAAWGRLGWQQAEHPSPRSRRGAAAETCSGLDVVAGALGWQDLHPGAAFGSTYGFPLPLLFPEAGMVTDPLGLC